MKKKGLLLIVLGVALVLAGAAVLWPAGPDARGSDTDRPDTAPAEPLRFERVEVTAATPSGLALSGIVRDAAGRPLPGAQVHLSASAQASLATVRCAECGELLLSCAAQPTWAQVAGLLEERAGQLEAGASTTSGADGRFRFESVSGVSFTVWAGAEGHGAAVQERAAPGDPVELFLPARRSIGGTVTDEQGAPVAGAHVHVVSRRIPVPAEATSGPQGVFEVLGLGEGPFYVLVHAPGFLPQAHPSVEAGPQPLRVKLVRPRALEVEVRRGGQPVDATVTLSGDHLERTAQAEGGFARLEGLSPDEVSVNATSGDLSAAPQTVTLSREVTRIRLALDAGGRLSVTVVDEAGHPVPDPELTLLRPQDAEPVLRRKGRTGELVFLGPVPHGEYLLVATAAGHQDAELPVQVGEGETAAELVLKRATLIRGQVLDVYGRPAPRISVLVNPTGQTVLADDEGRFEAAVPSPGFYELQAHHSDWGGGEAKVTAPADGVQLQLEPRAGLRVTATSEGRRVEGAEVVMWQERQTTFRSDRPSGSDGVVLMRGMPPATYNLVATHRDFLPSERQTVTVRDGELIEVTVDLQPGAAVLGQVVDEQGAPIPGATVGAIPRGSQPALTDADGRFELRPLREGRPYRLEATHPGFDQRIRATAVAGGEPVTVVLQRRALYRGRVLGQDGSALRSFRIDEQRVSTPDGRFELPLRAEDGRVFAVVDAPGFQAHMIDEPADRQDLGDILLAAEPRVAGVVKDSLGAPVEGAVVSCDACDTTARTGADGRFSLSIPPHLASAVVMANKGGLSGTASASSRAQGVEVVLRSAVRVSGRVFTAAGEPASGVEVEAVHVERAEPFTAVTMQDGSYSLEVPEGSYRITLPGLLRPFAGDPVMFAWIGGERMTLNLGAAPGTSGLTVHLTPQSGFALWVVRGVVGQVGNPPLELFKSEWAQMVYQPRAEVVNLTGLPPGRYTLIWARFHAQSEQAPHLQVVDLPGPRELTIGR